MTNQQRNSTDLEHIIPRAGFKHLSSTQHINYPKLKVHKGCNNYKSKYDNTFCGVMSSVVEEAFHKRHSKKIHKYIAGFGPEGTGIVRVKPKVYEDMNIWLDLVTRGLFCYHKEIILPSSYRVKSIWMQQGIPELLFNTLPDSFDIKSPFISFDSVENYHDCQLAIKQYSKFGTHIKKCLDKFEYTVISPTNIECEEDLYTSMWVLTFWNRVTWLTYTLPY